MPRASQGRYPFGDGERHGAGRFRRRVRIRRAVRQVLHRQPRQAGGHVAASVGLASGSVEPSPGMLAQFERAERIRQMFFSPGSKTPELAFIASDCRTSTPRRRGSTSTSTVSSLEIKPGAESQDARWSGPVRTSAASPCATFEDRTAAPEQAMGFDRPVGVVPADRCGERRRAGDSPKPISTPCSAFRRNTIRPRSRSKRRTPRAIRSPHATGGSSGANPDARTAPATDDRDHLPWAGQWK